MAKEQWDMVSFRCGSVAIVARHDQIVRVCFEGSDELAAEAVRKTYPEAERASQRYLTAGLTQLKEYFHGSRAEFDLPLGNSSLTCFADRVHRELAKVSLGSLISYGELAIRAGSPGAARAVGGVMSSNPFPLLIPCHRVISADGTIGQYSAAHGIKTKAWLIDFERKLAAP